jgi:hypothetical protein
VGIDEGDGHGGFGVASETQLRCGYCGVEVPREHRRFFYERWWQIVAFNQRVADERAAATPPIESHCARCLRPNPDLRDGSVPTSWEPLVTGGECVGVICEDCITPEERQAMDEVDMYLMRQTGIEVEDDE